MFGPPSPAEIRAYRDRTGCTATQAADHFYPSAVDEERDRAIDRIKKIFKRDREPVRQSDPNRPAPTDAQLVEGPPRPPADYNTARLDRPAFLEWELSELIADLTWVRSAGMVGRIAALDARVAEVRLQLDQARDAAGSNIEEDATPEDIAAEIRKRQKLIDELTEARDRRERHL